MPSLPQRSIGAVGPHATRRPEVDVSGDRGKALPRDVIDHVQHPEAPPAGELVMSEVQRPARIATSFHQDRGPCANGLAARFAFTDG